MEREKFEESWKKAFDEAEVDPSDKVWTNIELDLEKAKGGDLKKRLLFYQLLAAASIVFAMAIGGIGYYYSFRALDSSDSNIARNETQAEQFEQPKSNLSAENERRDAIRNGNADRQNQDPVPADTRSDNDGQQETKSRRYAGSTDPSTDKSKVAIKLMEENASGAMPADPGDFEAPLLPVTLDDKRFTPIYSSRKVVLHFDEPENTVDPVTAMMARLAAREKEVQMEEDQKEAEKNSDENLWTSVGFAAGSFNTVQASAPSTASRPATLAMAAAPILDQEAKATGYSYSMGVNVGTKLSERWVFQGGVNYLTHASEYVANNIVMDGAGNYQQQKFRAVSSNELMSADADDLSEKLVYSAPYNVNNNMRYLSIPLQAGYLVVNKTVGVQLNAGVATDLFLQNTISGQSDQLAKTSQSMGSDSPYRTVNISGLFGTEVSYRFGDHYRVSLNPGIRYPFNTIYKSELGVQSTPLTFDVGLRFRYIFK